MDNPLLAGEDDIDAGSIPGKAQIPDECDDEQLLLRIPVVLFGMPLGLMSQAGLYKIVGGWKDLGGLVVALNWAFWIFGNAALAVVGMLYFTKCWRHWWAVRQEWADGVRSNFMYTPIITVLLSLIATPAELHSDVATEVLWWTCIVWYCALSLPLYQSWLRKEHRTLHHGNPTYQIAVMSNFLIAIVGFMLGYNDLPFAFLSVGIVFQVTVFISMFTAVKRQPVVPPVPQQVSEHEGVRCSCLKIPSSVWVIPHDQLNPVMFLFIAPPSVASLAVGIMQGTFDNYFSRGSFSLALFLYAMQVASPQVFFSLAFSPSWWAFTFPTSTAAMAAVAFARTRPNNDFPDALAVTLTAVSTICVLSVFLKTMHSLFKGSYLIRDPLLDEQQSVFFR